MSTEFSDDTLLRLMEIVESQTGELLSVKDVSKLAVDLVEFYRILTSTESTYQNSEPRTPDNEDKPARL
jgi:hypothetical protein